MNNFSILPSSQSGKKSLYLMFIVILFAISAFILPSNMKTLGLPDFSATPLYATLIYGRIIASIATAVYAIIAIYKEQEKGLLIITALLQGFVYLISFVSVAVVYAMN
ncbi:MAG: hypothetical protein FD141_523 [Fusobacteria bacterium]|nr:MAG: hypothetical protein FD141_523 [Fusobacteriota bacterium]KAF0228812.1 MAG: hypothetical protein FD182_1068 [Fusobacteriota bacterium]